MAMQLDELISTLEELRETAKTMPTIKGSPELRIISGPWSAPIRKVSLFVNLGYVVIEASE